MRKIHKHCLGVAPMINKVQHINAKAPGIKHPSNIDLQTKLNYVTLKPC